MNTALLQDAFARNTALCLDGRIVRPNAFPVQAGGYADVFEGQFESQKVAIKVLRPFGLQRRKLLRRLWREYLTWSRLSHPNILACLGYSYDFSPESYTLPSLVSPWMENGSVTSYLKRFPDADRIALLVGIAKGLSYLHTCEPVVVHGDLRAGNVLVSDQGIPCLTDFGLSRVLEKIQGMTTSSDLAGSLRWMSPELFSSDGEVGVNVKSDIWAYGMTVLEVMSGKRPYSTIKNDIVVLGQIRDGKLPSRPQSAKVLAVLDDNVWTTCQKCWSQEPSSRPSMQEVTSMLNSRVNNERTNHIASSAVRGELTKRPQGQGIVAVVVFPYDSMEANEIDLIEGETIEQIEQLDEGWWSGVGAGGSKSGLFPANYVEVVENGDTVSPPPPRPPPAREPDPRVYQGITAIALYDYDAGEKNEITFREGDKITHIEPASDDWWQGTARDGSVGFFPANYVEVQE